MIGVRFLKSLWLESKAWVRISASRLFVAKIYRAQNPDIGYFPALIHWMKFGSDEGRVLGFGPLSEWLLPLVVNQTIGLKDVQRLRAGTSLDDLAYLAEELGLNINDYKYFRLIHEGLFKEAFEALSGTSITVFFDGAFYFADHHMRLTKLAEAYERTRGLELDASRLRRRADIAQTLGFESQLDILHMLCKIKDMPDRLLYQIFQARMPLFKLPYHECEDLTKRFLNEGLAYVDTESPGRCGEFARSVATFETLITAASCNSATDDLLCVVGDRPEKRRVVTLKSQRNSVIKVRLLMPNYWVPPQSIDSVTGPILVLQKALIDKILARGDAILPVFATPIFDITDEKNHGLTTLSYHTVTRQKKGEAYIHYKESYLPGYFTHDSLGYSGWSSLSAGGTNMHVSSENKIESDSYFEDIYQEFCVARSSKYTQWSAKASLPSNPFIFAALQVPEDTVAYWAAIQRVDWLTAICEFGETNKIPVVVKIHPKDKSQATRNILSGLAHYSQMSVSDANIHDLISQSSVVVTVNSGVGFEALLHHKPVITCGQSDYGAVALQVHTVEELTATLEHLKQVGNPISPRDINTFIYAYLNDHCWKGSVQYGFDISSLNF